MARLARTIVVDPGLTGVHEHTEAPNPAPSRGGRVR
jgi:hypothetical protein